MSKRTRIGIALTAAVATGTLLALTQAPMWVGALACGCLAMVGVPFVEVESWRRKP